MGRALARAAVEIGFIVFLFYANLLMGEFTRSGNGRGQTLLWGLRDVVTRENVVIALVAGVIGYGVVELLRRRLP